MKTPRSRKSIRFYFSISEFLKLRLKYSRGLGSGLMWSVRVGHWMRTARVIFFLSLSACCLRGVVAAVAAVFDLNPTLIWILKFVSEWRVCECSGAGCGSRCRAIAAADGATSGGGEDVAGVVGGVRQWLVWDVGSDGNSDCDANFQWWLNGTKPGNNVGYRPDATSAVILGDSIRFL